MTTKTESVAQITATAITLLSRELGVVNTARFFNQFTTGFGDYTAERHEILGDATVQEIVAEIKRQRKPSNDESVVTLAEKSRKVRETNPEGK